MKKLFVFDCDGTLINDDRLIAQHSIDAINGAIDKGNIVCLCTGRNFFQLEKYLANFPKIDLVGTLNGTVINFTKQNKSVILGKPLKRELLDDMLRIAQATKRELHWSDTNQKMYRVYFGTTPREDITDQSFFAVGTKNPKYDCWEDVKHHFEQDEIIHAAVKMEKSIIQPHYDYLVQKYHQNRDADVALSSEVYIDVSPYQCNKLSAVKYFQNYYQISDEKTYCFGDSDNDIPMMKNMQNAIVMGNGTNNVKYHSRLIIGDNNSNAIAKFIDHAVECYHPLKQLEPSLLAMDINNLDSTLKDLKQLGIHFIHYDVMDDFVQNHSFGNEWMQKIKDYGFNITVHLMVLDPLAWAKQFIEFKPFAITFQFEAIDIPTAIIVLDYIRKHKIKAGIAIKPYSSFNDYKDLLNHVDIVTIMTVEPGKGGQSFLDIGLTNLNAVFDYREQHQLKYLIQTDGGIKIDNVQKILAKTDLIVSGTGFMQLDQSQKKQFIELIKGKHHEK